jgi:long-chain acyl-CoA synthetase
MLFEPLFAHAASQANEIAMIDDRGSFTFAQIAAMSAGLSMYIGAQTRKPHVGILLPSSAGFAVSFYGSLLAGKTAVLINFLLGEKEIGHIIKDSGIDTVITLPMFAPKLQGLNIIDITSLPQVPPGAIAPRIPSVSPNDLAVLMYTSGTSGLPKGVMLSYGNLKSDVDSAISHAQLQGQHSFLGIVPLFHSTGLLATLIAPTQLGSKVVYIGRFSPVGTLKAIKEHQLSVITAVPSMYGAMLRLKDASPADFAHIYACISGGEPLASNIREGFAQKFNVRICEGYGLTETIGPIAFNTPQHMSPGSVGRLIPGASAKITDDNGNEVAAGESGEIWVKGPMIMQGYYNLPDATRNAITSDGFFKTGDLGRFDTDGYLHITGRKKDLIIVAGEKASPREIEEVLLRHPDIAEAAVIGKKDPSRGEVVVAFVIAKEGRAIAPETVRSFCGDQGLVNWKCPREVYVVDDLPRSPTGKVLKRVLAEQLPNS